MIYFVEARAFNRQTNEQIGEAKTEEINTDTNELFTNCNDEDDVKIAYESFWNELNPNSEEVILVDRVSI